MSLVLQGTGIVGGAAEGPALVTTEALAFNLGVDEKTGLVIERGHALEGQSVAGKVVVFRGGKGSSASSFSILQLVRRGCGPVALVNVQSDAVVAAGAVLARIPLVHRCDQDPTKLIRSGDRIRVDGDTGRVELLEDAS
jgi:hypothetical protein